MWSSRRGRVGQDDPLDRRVRDVALVPEGDVLDRGRALPRSTRASPATCSDLIGLRLCGIELEPFCPSANGSRPRRPRSAPGGEARSRTARARAGERDRLEQLGVAVACDDLRRDGLALQAEPRRAPAPRSPATSRSTYRRRREIAPTATCSNARSSRSGVAVGLEREAGELDPERRRLGVDPVSATDAQRVRRVRAHERRAPATSRARVGQHKLADAPQLQRQAGVEHVARGQSVVDPAAGRAGRGGEHVDERGRVVVGDLLALLDRLDRERRARGSPRAPRRSVLPSPRRRRPRPRASPRSGRGRTTPRRERHGCSERS